MKFSTLIALFATVSAVKMQQSEESYDMDQMDMEDQEPDMDDAETMAAELEEYADADADRKKYDEYAAYNAVPLLEEGKCYQFRNRAYGDRFFRHRGYTMYLDKINNRNRLFRKDSTFRVIPSKEGGRQFISLQSVNYPHHLWQEHRGKMYIRHVRNKLDRQNSSWRWNESPEAKGYVRFEHHNLPNYFVREHWRRLQIDRQRGGFFQKQIDWKPHPVTCNP